jgi:hypothetical protein
MLEREPTVEYRKRAEEARQEPSVEMASAETALQTVLRHMWEQEERISRQKESVAQLGASGQSTALAREVLQKMKRALKIIRDEVARYPN